MPCRQSICVCAIDPTLVGYRYLVSWILRFSVLRVFAASAAQRRCRALLSPLHFHLGFKCAVSSEAHYNVLAVDMPAIAQLHVPLLQGFH